VSRLVELIKTLPQLNYKVFPEKLVGQGQRQGTMTNVEQENTLQRFRLDSSDPRPCNLLVATDVAQEGLDMPKCNFVIRYNFVSNEIGSVQSKGRARAPNSECYLIVDKGSVNERREIENLEKEHMMMQALEEIDLVPEYELHALIASKRDELWENIQRKNERKNMDTSLLNNQLIGIHCRGCKRRLCGATDMRRYGSNFICIAKDLLNFLDVQRMAKQLEFRLDTQIGHTYCNNRECKHKIGLQLKYKKGRYTDGFSFNKEGVMWRFNGEQEYHHIKKWSAVPFLIVEEKMLQ
jgi:superfamily II DNA/RNA helicase